MGKVTPPTPPTDGGGPAPPTGTDAIVEWLTKIYNLLLSVFGLGQSTPQFLKVKIVTHLVFQPISPTPFRVKKAIVQNQTSTDVILIDDNNHSGVAVAIPTTGNSGFMLNPAGTSGQAGGSHPMGNIDLSMMFITGTVTDTLTLSVYVEQ